MLSLVLQAAEPLPPYADMRVVFGVSLVVIVSVVVFTSAVIVTLLRRADRRRVEEEKLAAIGTATARILHNVKNPLGTIVLNADMLQDERIISGPDQRREVCEIILGESQRLVEMLDELSGWVGTDKRVINRKPLRLHEVLLQVAAKEQRGPGGQGLRIDTSGINEVTVYADAYQIQQVFDNLVRNARDAMEAQEDRRLWLRVQRVGGMAEVRVSDNGPGITPENLDRIFGLFVSTKPKGMGLGLAFCREAVERHGGKLEAESVVGQGATFIVRLPVYEGPVGAESGSGTLAGAAGEARIG